MGMNTLPVLISRYIEARRQRLELEAQAAEIATERERPLQEQILALMAADGVTVTAAGRVAVDAAQVDLTASVLTVNAGMSKFSGVVQCDTLIANSVVSASYTPGAGNVY